MRELTKSVISFSLAASLLGMKQAVGMLMPQGRSSGQPTSNALDAVTQTAVSQLGPSLQRIFRTGDNLQRGMVNAMLGIFDPGSWNPAAWMPGTGTGSTSCSGRPAQSWGPVSPPSGGS
ncbi:MAG TPA: hypothetical protein VHA33_02145 [Candidatus Angelobacter sp.]|nr:hypothetical protein [Candidatus Angelobacter sp.]